MTRNDRLRQPDSSRGRIASAAARLMAEDGITDYGLAKKKAVRQLGLPERSSMPDNAEVEAALRSYQALYQGDEHEDCLQVLRQTALEVMEQLADFSPYLTGSVLDGSAGRYADIDILIFADNAKEVEIYLLNRGMPFEHAEPPNERVEAVLVLETEIADVRLTVLDSNLERNVFRGRDGRVRERARTEGVRRLVQAESNDGVGDAPDLDRSR